MLDAVDLFHLQGAPILDIIDRQHTEILRRRQNLRSAIVEGMGMDQIVASAKDLIDTTLEHFTSEEGAMRATRFSGLEMHKHLHDGMIATVNEIWSGLQHRKINNALELLKFFDVRLAYHLDSEDGGFGRELKDMK